MRLEEVLQEIIDLGFEFVGLSVVDPYRELIEMIKAKNIPSGWLRRSKRGLHSGDIMADVLRKKRWETPPPDDPRFDRKTWEIFRHWQLARAFIPVFFGDEPVGILQAGWEREHKGDFIPVELVEKLVEMAARSAEDISRARPHVLLEHMCREVIDSVIEAESATVHVCRSHEVLLEAGAGKTTHGFVRQLASDPEGVVWSVADNGHEERLDSSGKLRERYPGLHEAGCRTLLAFPLQLGEQVSGAFLVYFQDGCRIGNSTAEQVRIVVRHVESAIQNRMLLTASAALSSRAWMQSRLKTVEDAMSANVSPHEMRERVADHFLYNLEADCVTFYEYSSNEPKFAVPPVMSGEFYAPKVMGSDIQPGNLLWRYIEGGSQFISWVAEEEVLCGPRQDGSSEPRFAARENIESCAVLVLEAGEPAEKLGSFS